MTIRARVIADSVPAAETLGHGTRLTTLELRYPRMLHAELLTHRVFSRNASSSRAIPIKRLIRDVLTDTAMPIHWGKAQKGMQADEEHEAKVVLGPKWLPLFIRKLFFSYTREEAWIKARDAAVRVAEAYAEAGYHKQVANRLIEPFAHINVVLSSTEWTNFFALRDHKDAYPEIKALAQAMKQSMDDSDPQTLRSGDWHLPYVTSYDRKCHPDHLLEISTARCARVSYKTHDGRLPSAKEDINLYDQLVGGDLKHASPAEHQGSPDRTQPQNGLPERPELHGNFSGWIQHRKTLANENITS